MWEEFSSVAYKAGAQIQEGITRNVLGLREVARIATVDSQWLVNGQHCFRQYHLTHFMNTGRRRRSHNSAILQDNAPCHTSKKVCFEHLFELLYLTPTFLQTKGLLQSMCVQFLQIPPNSPDLNPIETVSATMRKVLHKEEQTLNLKEKVIRLSRNHMKRRIIDQLISLMPERLVQVVKRRGQFSDY